MELPQTWQYNRIPTEIYRMSLCPLLLVWTRRGISPIRMPVVGTAVASLKPLRLPTPPLGITNATSLSGPLATPQCHNTKLESTSVRWHQPASRFKAMAQIIISPDENNSKSTPQHHRTVYNRTDIPMVWDGRYPGSPSESFRWLHFILTTP